MNWLTKRFGIQRRSKEYAWEIYREEKELARLMYNEAVHLQAIVGRLIEAVGSEQMKRQDLEANFGRITLEEVKDLIIGLANYHDVCVRCAFPDPVRQDIQYIFDKYNIKVKKPGTWIA